DPSNAQRLWTGGFFLWRTTNGAASWTQASAITAGNGSVSALAVAPTNANMVLAGMSDGFIHRTTIGLTSNSSTNWPFVQPRAGYVSWLAFDPTNANIAYATYSTFGGTHVWKSTDGGATWTGIDGSGATGIPDIPVHSIVVDPAITSRLYVGTDLGVFVSRDGGATWAVENTGFANVITEALAVANVGAAPHIFAFTHGRGVWRVPTADATGISVTPTSHDFGTVDVGNTADRTFTVQNTGGGTLTGTAVTAAPNYSIVSGGSFSLGPGASQDTVVRFAPTGGGTFAGSANFTSNGGDFAPTVTGVGVVPPLTLTGLTASLPTPQPVNATITFTATASGGTPPLQFKWWVYDGAVWRVGQDWGPSATFAWTPLTPGSYTIGAWARSNGNTVDWYEGTATRSLAFTITGS
ncbi:MAG TPA: choice-of-anchor D domain-containing protein, partial [Gemmatimonadales bacterium]|nr:choice-of-anchor D domain-containing protein [Gemmatimonadales bacterium]